MLVAMPEQEWVDEERAEGEAPGGAQAARGPRPVGVDAARELRAICCNELQRIALVAPSYPEPAISGMYCVTGASGSRRRFEARIPQTHPTIDFETDISR